jgi:Trypsin-co-occurring domain 2
MDGSAPGVSLADAIERVRSELQKAAAAGAGSSIAFKPDSVELEFDVVFDTSASGDAGVRVWVVSIGAKGEVSRGQTQRLKVTLSPIDRATGGSPVVSDEGDR